MTKKKKKRNPILYTPNGKNGLGWRGLFKDHLTQSTAMGRDFFH